MKVLAKCKFIIIILITILSCSKDESLIPLSKDQALELISTSYESYNTLIDEFYSLNLSANLEYFEFLLLKSGFPESNISINNFGNAFPITFEYVNQVYSIPNGSNTPLGDYGTYTWNFTNEHWDYSNEPNNRVVYLFPSNGLSEENDANLRFENYLINVVDEVTFPMKFIMTLRVDDIFVSSTSYEAITENDRISRFSIGINQNPFVSIFNVQSKSTSAGDKATVTYSLKKDNVTKVSSKLELLFPEPINTNTLFISGNDNFDRLIAVQGYVQVNSLKYTFDFNLEEFRKETPLDQMESSANSNLKIHLFTYPTGESVAGINWTYIAETAELMPNFVFNDGSVDEALVFLPEIIKKLLESFLD